MAAATRPRRRHRAVAAALSVSAGLAWALCTGTPAAADPPPGCGFVSGVWWSPCHVPPPVPGQGWTPVDGIPGTFGPHGYTPIQEGTPNAPGG